MKSIHEATKEGKIADIKKLIKMGVSIDQQSEDKSTPLLYAVEENNDEMVNFLIENKAGVNIPNELGVTPLHASAAAGNELLTCILIEANANPNSKDINVWFLKIPFFVWDFYYKILTHRIAHLYFLLLDPKIPQ